MQDSSVVVINYINSSLCKCIFIQPPHRDAAAFICTRSLYPARKYYAHLLRRKGSGGRVTSFSACLSCEIIPMIDRGDLTVACLVLYELVARGQAYICVGVEKKRAWPDQVRKRRRVWWWVITGLTAVPFEILRSSFASYAIGF